MRAHRIGWLILAVLTSTAAAAPPAVKLPDHYFKLMEAEVAALSPDNLKPNAGAMLAAAVLFSKQHPANPGRGDRRTDRDAHRRGARRRLARPPARAGDARPRIRGARGYRNEHRAVRATGAAGRTASGPVRALYA